MFDAVNVCKFRQVRFVSRLLRRKSALVVYDEYFAKEDLRREMDAAGFEVVTFVPVVRHYFVQYALGVLGFEWLAARLEHVTSLAPLEWVVVCRKR